MFFAFMAVSMCCLHLEVWIQFSLLPATKEKSKQGGSVALSQASFPRLSYESWKFQDLQFQSAPRLESGF